MKISATALLAAGVLGYGWFRIRDFAEGPSIAVLSPQNGALITESLVEVRGRALHISDITLNNRKIFTDKEGYWNEKLVLHEGLNTVLVSATDRFGRTTEQKLELVRKERGT